MISYSLFIVDDEESIREGITLALSSDYRILGFSTAEEAINEIRKSPPDLVLLDIGLPGINGIQAIRKFKECCPDIVVIIITAYEDINSVISAMKFGAYDYILKPLHMNALEVTIRNALENIRLRKEVQTLQEKYLKENFGCFIGESNAIQDVMEFIKMVAKSPDTPILIIGETGTGKELIASAIHYRSPNFKGKLVTVNCAAIPNYLIESELFGYEKGAFTGAKPTGKKGLIEEAVNGTFFLDEVGDLNLEAQAKLLRFLETGEFYRVGGTDRLYIKTRVVSATNKDLEEMINKGLFRKDLYFRLGVIKVEVPSLTERREDIIPLSKHFLLEFSTKFGKHFTGFTKEAIDVLMNYQWVGNIRELKNIIERGVLIGNESKITLRDLGIKEMNKAEQLRFLENEINLKPISESGIDFPSFLESIEKFYIKEALKMAGGNECKAAKLLNINHHTFRYHKKRLRID